MRNYDGPALNRKKGSQAKPHSARKNWQSPATPPASQAGSKDFTRSTPRPQPVDESGRSQTYQVPFLKERGHREDFQERLASELVDKDQERLRQDSQPFIYRPSFKGPEFKAPVEHEETQVNASLFPSSKVEEVKEDSDLRAISQRLIKAEETFLLFDYQKEASLNE
ncbi:hypothetical protein [Hutsoniella sourekii]|uniref:hypothetical protein n=1 Tax=Hutsoniella sourekii TaxID=87650 RepID=UPI0004816841|nr:hypothetical protein [Hutsoniella sourekii]